MLLTDPEGHACAADVAKLSDNYTSKQREFMFAALVAARSQLGRDLAGPTDKQILELARQKLRDWCAMSGIHRDPTDKTFRTLWKQFLDPAGTISKIKKPGGKVKDIDGEIESAIVDNRISSIKKLAAQLPEAKKVCHGTVYNHMRKISFCFYTKNNVKILHQCDRERRLDFANLVQKLFDEGQLDVNNILFTDECLVEVGPNFNRQIDGACYVKRYRDDDNQLVQKKAHDDVIHIFVAIHARIGLIGPWFVDEIQDPASNVNQADKKKRRNVLTDLKYQRLLNYHVIPVLEERLGDDFESCWWQQDGVPAHCADGSLKDLGYHFEHRILSKRTKFEWPDYSADMNPFDYGLWSEFRKQVLAKKPKDREGFKFAAREVRETISLDYIAKLISDFPIRIRACQAREGGHFEPILKEFKLLHNISTLCDMCEQVHDCPCIICDKRCARRSIERKKEEELGRRAAEQGLESIMLLDSSSFLSLSGINFFKDGQVWEEIDD